MPFLPPHQSRQTNRNLWPETRGGHPPETTLFWGTGSPPGGRQSPELEPSPSGPAPNLMWGLGDRDRIMSLSTVVFNSYKKQQPFFRKKKIFLSPQYKERTGDKNQSCWGGDRVPHSNTLTTTACVQRQGGERHWLQALEPWVPTFTLHAGLPPQGLETECGECLKPAAQHCPY